MDLEQAAGCPPDVASLVALLEQRNGTISVTDPPRAVRAQWRRLIWQAINQGPLPAGTRMLHTGRDRGDLTITLSDASRPMKPSPPPEVPVPKRLPRHIHPSLAKTRQAANERGGPGGRRDSGVLHHNLSRAQVNRMLRIAHALFTEGERRGWTASALSVSHDCGGGLGFLIDGHPLEIVFHELARRKTPEEVKATRSTRYPRYEDNFVPTGRLQIRLGHGSWAILAVDGKRRQLEALLGVVCQKLEARAEEMTVRAREAAEAHARRLEAERRQEEHRRRVAELDAQLAAWERAEQIRGFVAGARADRPSPTPPEAAWLMWVTAFADQLDPLLQPELVGPKPLPSRTDRSGI